MKQNTESFIQTQRQKQLFITQILIVHLNQSIVWLCQNAKILGRRLRLDFIDSVIEQNANFSKYKPLSGSSYIKLPKELNHSRKVWLIVKILMITNV